MLSLPVLYTPWIYGKQTDILRLLFYSGLVWCDHEIEQEASMCSPLDCPTSRLGKCHQISGGSSTL